MKYSGLMARNIFIRGSDFDFKVSDLRKVALMGGTTHQSSVARSKIRASKQDRGLRFTPFGPAASVAA